MGLLTPPQEATTGTCFQCLSMYIMMIICVFFKVASQHTTQNNNSCNLFGGISTKRYCT